MSMLVLGIGSVDGLQACKVCPGSPSTSLSGLSSSVLPLLPPPVSPSFVSASLSSSPFSLVPAGSPRADLAEANIGWSSSNIGRSIGSSGGCSGRGSRVSIVGGRAQESGRAPLGAPRLDAVDFKQREKVFDLVRFHDSWNFPKSVSMSGSSEAVESFKELCRYVEMCLEYLKGLAVLAVSRRISLTALAMKLACSTYHSCCALPCNKLTHKADYRTAAVTVVVVAVALVTAE